MLIAEGKPLQERETEIKVQLTTYKKQKTKFSIADIDFHLASCQLLHKVEALLTS